MVNVHPSLLPAFPGAHAVADALAWGARVTGVTVHLVDEQVDHGPIVFQEAVAVRPDDDRESLEARIHEVEHRLLPRAVRALAEGRLAGRGADGRDGAPQPAEAASERPRAGAGRRRSGAPSCR